MGLPSRRVEECWKGRDHCFSSPACRTRFDAMRRMPAALFGTRSTRSSVAKRLTFSDMVCIAEVS